MQITKNIRLYIFATSIALLLFIPVSTAQTIRLHMNSATRNNDQGSPREEYSSVIEKPLSNIKELIAGKYRKRYKEWKNEFLSTGTGRRQWEFYACHPSFILTITICGDMQDGARTNQFKWSESGELISATITLGSEIDKGFPDPAYYPVINALQPARSTKPVTGRIVAAAKIAHEFGHLNRAISVDGGLYQIQYRLIPVYNSIFQNNGFDARDPRLTYLAALIGGTPVEINEDGEYWGELNVMIYLRERIVNESFQRSLVGRIRENVS